VKQQPRRKEPILTIELGHQSSTVKIIRPGYPEMKIEKAYWGYGNLAEYYERYHQALESFKFELQSDSLIQDLGALTNAFKALFKTGKVLFERLFEDGTREILNYLRNYIILASASKHLPSSEVGVIKVIAENFIDIIPIECLVIIGSEPEVRCLPDVARATSGILGFSFIINRVIKSERLSQKRELNNVPQLPLKYFYDKSLTGTNTELEFFGRNKRHFYLDGPWPEEYAESTVKDLVRYLFRPDIGFGQTDKTDTEERPRDEVHHLSCHGYTDEECPWKCSLQLTGHQPITLEAMQELLPDLRHSGTESKREADMPLVFLNACGSSKLTPKGMTSFPQYFLFDNKNCGFIGSETSVPDLFASEFCQQFYLHLLRGFGVGEAIFRARHKMLERYQNPLGILYTSYVDPYLRVTKAVDSI